MKRASKRGSAAGLKEHVVSTKVAAEYLALTERRVQQLAAEGWVKPVGRGRWSLVEVIAGYVESIRAENAKKTKSAADSRVRDARAAEIERRMAREDRKIIALDEAMAAFDHATGLYLQSLSGLPARMTRNASERRRLEAICDTERERLSHRFAEGASALRTGVEAAGAEDEDDA